MVMDQLQSPSAQCVGQEFVRQYYTLMNQAPNYLHRFYSHDSSFLHGGDGKSSEEAVSVVGQKVIHEKIMSLNFKRCHAKIRQVDAQPSVGNCVVVQVTGELSNNGEPMRRFMQTFVLAPQTPKKYYVHNDIFRYQDEVFYDSDEEEEQMEEVPEAIQDGTVSSAVLGYPPMEQMMNPMIHQQPAPETAPAPAQGQSLPPMLSPPQQQQQPTPHLGNGQATHQEMAAVATVPEPVVADGAAEQESDDFEDALEAQHPDAPAEPIAPAKPSSWAGVLAGAGSQPAPPPSALKPSVAAPKPATKPPQASFGNKDEFGQGPRPPRDSRPPRGPDRPERVEREMGRGGLGGEQQGYRVVTYPDTQQLFVGNLPHQVPDKELKEFFEKYGKVIDMRINRKRDGRDVPNFGFIIFEEAETVSTILQSKPIMLGSHRLNVEEKKAKSEMMPRPSSGNRPPRGGGANGGHMGPMRGDKPGWGGNRGRGGMRGGPGDRPPRGGGGGGYGRM